MDKKLPQQKSYYLWGVLRLGLGAIFMWAFLDKLFGLGFATCRDTKTDVVTTMCDKAWINGGSPTTGFLKNATKGPFEGFFQNLAGNTFVDWLFMLALLGLGIALLLGIGIKIAAVSGTLLLGSMYFAAWPPENNPLLDDHLIYIVALWGILIANSQQELGAGRWWSKQELVKKYSILE